MLKLTPDWEELSKLLIFKLDDIADDISLKVDNGEDPAYAVNEAVMDLELFIGAIKENPSLFTMKDVS